MCDHRPTRPFLTTKLSNDICSRHRLQSANALMQGPPFVGGSLLTLGQVVLLRASDLRHVRRTSPGEPLSPSAIWWPGWPKRFRARTAAGLIRSALKAPAPRFKALAPQAAAC